jgi:hypothetical protein
MAYQGRLNIAYSRILRRYLGDAIREELLVSEPAPESLVRLLERLECRVRADVERERLYAAVQQAVDKLIRLTPHK